MRFEFRREDKYFFHVASGACAGYLRPLKNGKGFSVHRDLTNLNERDKIGAVKSIDEALPMLTEYYETHWPQWKRTRDGEYDRDAGYTMYTVHRKWSFFGVFEVRQQEDGRWIAERDTDALTHDGKRAAFATAELARYVVDRHELDGFHSFMSSDGYRWSN